MTGRLLLWALTSSRIRRVIPFFTSSTFALTSASLVFRHRLQNRIVGIVLATFGALVFLLGIQDALARPALLKRQLHRLHRATTSTPLAPFTHPLLLLGIGLWCRL